MSEIVAKLTHSQTRAKDFYRFHLFRKSPIKYIYYGISSLVIILAVIFYFLMKYELALFLVFISIMILIIRVVNTNITINKIIKDLRFPSINYTLKFNSQSVIYQYDSFKKEYLWDNIIVICEVNNYLYFYITPSSALILTKYTISEEERILLQSLITNAKVKHYQYKFK